MILQAIEIAALVFFGVGAVMLATWLLGKVVLFWALVWEYLVELARKR